MQIDFAENYSLFYQDEIQFAQWHKTPISVFTVAIWQCGECVPAVVVSGDLSHSKEYVFIFLDTLLPPYSRVIPKSSSKLFYCCLPWFESKLNLTVHWNFFASSHGKGPVYVIGRTTKRLTANIVTSHKGIITDSHSFVKTAESSPKVKVLHVTSTDIKQKLSSCGLNVLIKKCCAFTRYLQCPPSGMYRRWNCNAPLYWP